MVFIIPYFVKKIVFKEAGCDQNMWSDKTSQKFPPLGKEIQQKLEQIPANVTWDLTPHRKALILQIEENVKIDHQTAGRLLLINGHCREQGIQVIIRCPAPLKQHLANYTLDRLCFIES